MNKKVKILKGNIFCSKAQTIVNTVNCVGVMGKGIALEFKKRFPEMHDDYLKKCKNEELNLGKPYIFKSKKLPWIINFPTKKHWRSVSKISDIEKGLEYLLKNYRNWGVKSLAVPPLGCGQGQLDWVIVGKTLYEYLSKSDIQIELYAPFDVPDNQLELEFLSDQDKITERSRVSKIQPAWIAIVEIISRLQEKKYTWPVGRTTFQKIAFVATLMNLPTGLEYMRSSYGPFSKDTKQMLVRLINNGLIVEESLHNRMFLIKVGNTFSDAKRQYQNYLNNWEKEIERITDLFSRVNSVEAEIIATILFVANEFNREKKSKPTEMDILNEINAWKERRKPKLNSLEIATKIRNLAILGWLDVLYSNELPVPSLI